VRAVSGRAQLAFEAVGEQDGRDVLLIHAGVADRRSWSDAIDRLTLKHRCISYDARGYGQTTYALEEGWSPVRDAVAVLDAAGSDRACVVGASMGGSVALDLTLVHPERVSGLILIGSGVSGAPANEPEAPATVAVMEAIDRAEAAEDLEEVNRLEARLWLDGAEAPEGRVRGAARELFLEMNGHALRAADPGPQAQTNPAWPRLSQISAPATVMVGDLDLVRLRHIGAALAATIPQARHVELPNVAHLPHLEGDATTLEAIAEAASQIDC
jgi:pimeloyl-ACP methyl ester carboxylesterase